MNLISIDIETTGLDPNKHNVVSIGAVNPLDGYEFYREIYYKDLVVSCDTQVFSKINFSKIEDASQRSEPKIVIFDLTTWLINQHHYKPIIAMGLNVGSFDLQFIKILSASVNSSGTTNLFSHRSLDLNSAMMTLSKMGNVPFMDFKEDKSKSADDLFKANRPEKYKLGKHHALFDAWFNVYLWEILTFARRSNV